MNQEINTPLKSDVVIIGGGIMGCAAAYYLSQRGAEVTLLEKGRLVGEQSSRAWGFVRQQNRDPAELPLMVAGNRLWRELSAELKAEIEWRQEGMLSLAHTEDELMHYEERAKLEQAHGVDSRMVTPEKVRELLPGFSGNILGALHTPSDGTAEPEKVSTAFVDAARRSGVRMYPYCAVEGLTTRDGKVASVITEKGEIQTNTVICAAGAHSSRIGRMVGLDLPVRTVRSTVAATAPLPEITGLGVRGGKVSFRQRENGSVYLALGSQRSADYDITLESFRHFRQFLPNYLKNREMLSIHIGKPLLADAWRALPFSKARKHPFAHTVDIDPAPNPKLVEQSLREFKAFFPKLPEVKIERSWAGMIDSMPDLIPVISPVQKPQGFIFATGFSGHGFAMGPIVGHILAELVLDGKSSIDLTGLRFSRFAEGELGVAAKVR